MAIELFNKILIAKIETDRLLAKNLKFREFSKFFQSQKKINKFTAESGL